MKTQATALITAFVNAFDAQENIVRLEGFPMSFHLHGTHTLHAGDMLMIDAQLLADSADWVGTVRMIGSAGATVTHNPISMPSRDEMAARSDNGHPASAQPTSTATPTSAPPAAAPASSLANRFGGGTAARSSLTRPQQASQSTASTNQAAAPAAAPEAAPSAKVSSLASRFGNRAISPRQAAPQPQPQATTPAQNRPAFSNADDLGDDIPF